MLSAKEYELTQKKAAEWMRRVGIAVTPAEEQEIEIADFNLGDLYNIGLEILVYVNTERVCAKELVMFPRQICPEHQHPTIDGVPGKEETFRCRWGEVYLYVPGRPTPNPKAVVPNDAKDYFTSWHEVVLRPGEQYTLNPETLHWFQSGPEGAVVSEFSTTSKDKFDIFTDPRIQRFTKIQE